MNEDIYNPEFVTHLFNRMSKTYGTTNYISSFGFTERWRRQCVQALSWSTNQKFGQDWMSGMGECWELIMLQTKGEIQLQGLDFSPQMNQKARRQLDQHPEWNITILEKDVLNNDVASESLDFVISAFGLKTFSPTQLERLAQELNRVLKPGAQFSFIEISSPRSKLLNFFYLFYLKRVIPIIGMLFMGNSMDYRMLGQYCERFINCLQFAEYLKKAGLNIEYREYFYGCASGVIGCKPV